MHSHILLTVWSGILGYMHACMKIVTLCWLITPNNETDFVIKPLCIQYKQTAVHTFKMHTNTHTYTNACNGQR